MAFPVRNNNSKKLQKETNNKFPNSPKPKSKTCSKTSLTKSETHQKFSKTLTISLKDKALIYVMNNDPYYNFCLEEIKFYTEKINEIIIEGLKDPKKYYEESKGEWKKIYQMIPVMYMMNQIEDRELHT